MRLFTAFVLLLLLGRAPAFAAADDAGPTRIVLSPYQTMNLRNARVGTGATDGMTGQRAVYIDSRTRRPNGFYYYNNPSLAGSMVRRKISLEPWRGHRLRLTLRVKDEGDVRGWTSFQVNNAESLIVPRRRQWHDAGDTSWVIHQIVFDVPADARDIDIGIGALGLGTVWMDEAVLLQPVGRDVSVSNTRRILLNTPAGCVAGSSNVSIDPACSMIFPEPQIPRPPEPLPPPPPSEPPAAAPAPAST